MQKLRFKRFHKPQFLKRIRRELLTGFFAHFESSKDVALPPPDAPDSTYFAVLTGLLHRPERLPLEIFEALFAVEEMSLPEGLLRLERTPEWPSIQGGLLPESTAEDIAMQAWLLAPQALARAHNGLRLRRLTAFEHAEHERTGEGSSVQPSVFSPHQACPRGGKRRKPGVGSGGIQSRGCSVEPRAGFVVRPESTWRGEHES